MSISHIMCLRYTKRMLKPILSKAHLSMPEVKIKDSKCINASVSFSKYTLIVTNSAVDDLNKNEFTGALAHEVGHLYSKEHHLHSKVMSILNIIFFSLFLVPFSELFVLYNNKILLLFLFLIFFLIELAIINAYAQQAEFLADKLGVKFSNHKDMLALMYFMKDGCVIMHSYENWLIYKIFFDTHPSEQHRINRIYYG